MSSFLFIFLLVASEIQCNITFFLSQGDGTEEVIACSWDGQTYIANLNRDVVRFQFQENVAAFYAGKIYLQNVFLADLNGV